MFIDISLGKYEYRIKKNCSVNWKYKALGDVYLNWP